MAKRSPTAAERKPARDAGPMTLDRLSQQEKAIYKPNPNAAADNFEFVAHKLAVEISFVLAEKVDELAVMRSSFRLSLESACQRTLRSIFRREERCVVVPDALPGFTLMGFKREGGLLAANGKGKAGNGKASEPARLSPESHAAALIIGEFFEKTEEQVLVIDCPDALLVLFPVSDLRKNLKQLGFYHVD